MFVPVAGLQKGEDGLYRCKDCGSILDGRGWYCDNCEGKRQSEARKTLNILFSYWWLILIVAVCLLIASLLCR